MTVGVIAAAARTEPLPVLLIHFERSSPAERRRALFRRRALQLLAFLLLLVGACA
jgi:hypothetical protein